MKAGSQFLSRARPVAEAASKYISLSLFGRNGAGKTTFACQFPKPLLLLSMEASDTGGAGSVVKIPGVEWMVVRSSDEVMGVANELLGLDHGYKSVVLDGPTNWEKIVLAEIQGADKPLEVLYKSKVTMDQYVYRSEKMRNYCRPFLDLASKCNVIFCSNEKDHNAEKDMSKSIINRGTHAHSKLGPDVGAGFANWLTDWANYSCQLFVDEEMEKSTADYGSGPVEVSTPTGKFIRYLRVVSHPNYMTRPRSPNTEIPDLITGSSPADLYAKFMEAIS